MKAGKVWGQTELLTVPLSEETNPPCVFFVKEVSRQSEVLQLHKLI